MGKDTSKPLYIADHLFFLIEEGEVLVWNFKLHEQFSLERKYFLELLKIAEDNECGDENICKELIDANLVSSEFVKPREWGWDILSMIFHIGTQNVGEKIPDYNINDFTNDYLNRSLELKDNIPQLFLEREGPLIKLPKPDIARLEKISFFAAIKNRKTCRAFNSEPITLEELSLVLYCSFGLIHGEWEEFNQYNLRQTGIRKSSPSSGGLHSEEVYIVANRINGLKQGLYHYRPQDHQLTQLKEGNFEKKTIEMNYEQFFSEGMAFGIYLTSRLEKIWWKYKHSRAYRGVLLDVGHVSQVFLNCASAMDLQTWLTGAFHDSDVENFLGLDTDKEVPILFVGAGKGNNQAIPDIMIKKLKE